MRSWSLVTICAAAALAEGWTSTARSLEPDDLPFKYWEDPQGAGGCAACESIIGALKLAAWRGDDFFVSTVTGACQRSAVEDDDVCEGTVALEGPIIARALREMRLGSATSRQFCITSLGLCAHPKIDPYEVPFPSPKPPAAKRPPPSGQEPLKVVHFSDIHIDPFYVEGSEANCTKPICCRDYNDELPPFPPVPAGPHGDHQCDSPRSLGDGLWEAIGRIVPNASFSIFTGDIVDHAVWNTTKSQNMADIQDAYAHMSDAGMLVYGTAGNHESSPANSYPPSGVNDDSQWVYDTLSSMWSRWVGDRGVETSRDFGAYSVRHQGTNLRVISLNTNLHYAHNYWLYEEPMKKDPSGHLSWLVAELDAAEKAGERVYIMGHMPMGSRDAFHEGSNHFDQIVNRYSATIASMFFGHTHMDEFELSYSNYSERTAENVVAMTYIAPSLTPTSGHPSFRVYDVDPVTFGVLDSTTYYADMDDPKFQTEGPAAVWKKYYSAKEVYGPLVWDHTDKSDKELTPVFWHRVTEALEQSDSLFDDYLARKRRGWLAGEETCDEDCKKREICKLRAARAQDNCILPRPRLDLGRRKGMMTVATAADRNADDADADECEGSAMRNLLGSVRGQLELLSMFANGEFLGDDADMGEL